MKLPSLTLKIKKQPSGSFQPLTAAGAAIKQTAEVNKIAMNKADIIMNKIAKILSTTAREHISKKNFAIPSKKNKSNPAGHGAYPIEDKKHARNALARVSQFGSSAQKAEVRAKVHAKYPNIGQEKKAMPHFEDQNRPKKEKEIFHALKEEHPELSAESKARIAAATYNKMHKKGEVVKLALSPELLTRASDVALKESTTAKYIAKRFGGVSQIADKKNRQYIKFLMGAHEPKMVSKAK